MPLPLAIATGGMRDTALRLGNFTWGSFKDRLRKPQIGGKDGSYYIRGSELRQPRRSDENLLSAKTIILDGDSSINPETGEIVSGAPDLNEVVAALKDMGITFCAHTSHSFIPGELWKYRIIIPADIPNQEYLDASVNWLISQLHARGIWLADVTENHRWSQPWYSSRVRDREALKDFMFIEHEAGTFPILDAINAAIQAQKQQEKEEQARRLQPVSVAPEGNIQAFNKSFTLNDARSLLESAGYRFGYYEKGKDAYRFMRPGSETKTYGVVLFKGAMGDWCTYSHHGSADPLSSRVCDPFELVATLKYGSDLKACARGIFPKERSIVEKLRDRVAVISPPGGVAPFTPSKDEFVIDERSKILPPLSENAISNRDKMDFVPENFQSEENAILGLSRVSDEIAVHITDTLHRNKRVNLVAWQDLRDEPVRYLVDGLIPARSFGAIFGKPGSYKSFVALYLAAMVATGREAFGRKTGDGPQSVIYIAGEGGAGLKRRRDALMRHYDLPADAPVYFIRAQLNLATTLEDRDALLAEIRALNISPSLVIIDTFARATAGIEENSAKDVGAAIAIFGSIEQETGAAVLIVHHSGKNQDAGMRGSSALLAAVDCELHCEKISPEGSQERVGKLTLSKSKDSEDGLEIPYKMETVALSDVDPSNNSLAVVPATVEELAGFKKNGRLKLSKDAAIALSALEQAIAEGGVIPPIGAERLPSKNTRGSTESLWRGYWRKITTKTDGAERTAWSRAKEQLFDARKIDHWGEFYWLVKETEPEPLRAPALASYDDIPFE
jgi:hypothetical protein